MLCGALFGCAEEVTAIDLQIEHAAALTIEHYRVGIGELAGDRVIGRDVRLIVPDAMADTAQTIQIWGIEGDRSVAYGMVDVTPVRGQTIHATAMLSPIACDSSCTPGEARCAGDAIVRCGVDAMGCPTWTSPMPCPSTAPFCSSGACSVTCEHECEPDAAACDGAAHVRRCGEADTDSCRDWLPPEPCAGCEAGVCTGVPSCTPTPWTVATVDPAASLGATTSIVVDGASQPRLAYRGRGGGLDRLYYATVDAAGTWSKQLVPVVSDVHVSWTPRLVLDAVEAPHIVSQAWTGTSSGIFHSTRTISGWQTVRVAAAGDGAPGPTIAVTPAGDLHFAMTYADNPWVEVHVRSNVGGTWSTQTALASDGVNPKLASDPDGNLSLILRTSGDRLALYRKPINGDWGTEIELAADGVTDVADMAVDRDGAAHVVYRRRIGTTYDVHYTRAPLGGSLVHSTIATNVGDSELGWAGEVVAVAVDESSRVHVVFDADEMTAPTYAVGTGDGPWTTTVIGSIPAAAHLSLAVDALGGLHLSYSVRPATSTEVRYAYFCASP